MSKENVDPDLFNFKPTKKRKTTEEVPTAKRFKPATTNEDMEAITKGYIPQNTQRNTAWSSKVFLEWRSSRKCAGEEVCPDNLFEEADPEKLNHWIPRFINEVVWKDGKPYPPKTIFQILSGLQRHMLDKNHCAPRFLNRQNPIFRPIRI